MYLLTGLGTLTTDLASSIARFEGSCTTAGSCRNNNPGNLRAGPGSVGLDSRGFAIFPDPATGWAALDHQVDLNIGRGLSLQEFFGGKPGVYAGYAPAADANNPAGYAATVGGWLGIDPTVPLSQVSASPAPISPGLPADSSPTFDSSSWVDPSGTGLSSGAMWGLGIAAAALLYMAVG
jgi:hypothetical protein